MSSIWINCMSPNILYQKIIRHLFEKKKNYNETNSFVLQTSWTLYYAFRSWKLQTYLVKHSFSNFETHVDNQGETMCMFLINLYLTHHNAVFGEPFDVQDPLWAFQIWLLSIFPLNQKATFFFLKQMEFKSQRLSLVQKIVRLTQSDKTCSLA